MKPSKALIINEVDNVATAVQQIKAGETICIDSKSKVMTVLMLDDIAFGHKFALCDIDKNCPVVKYGETIGVATQEIRVGNHVHIHNVESCRGRGDKK